MFVWCPAELGLPHHTHQSMQTALTRTRREAQINGHKYTLSDTHTPSIALIGTVCCVLPDLSMSLSASLFFSLLFFQAAISARPCHLFSMLWNTVLPLAAGVFTRWQKLSIGVIKKTKPSIQK